MSREALETFCRSVLQEPALDAALKEPADLRSFAELLSRLARERGLDVEEAEVLETVAERRRDWLSRWP